METSKGIMPTMTPETQQQDNASLVNLEGLATQYGYIPAELPRPTATIDAEGLLRKFGRQPRSNAPWLPLTIVGPVLVFVHYDPKTDDFWGFPDFLSTKVVIHREQYEKISEDFSKRVSHNPLPPENPASELEHPQLPPGDLSAAFDWLIANFPYSDQEVEKLKRDLNEQIKKTPEMSIGDFNAVRPQLGVALEYITNPHENECFNPEDANTQSLFPNHLLEKYGVYPLYCGKQRVYLMHENADLYGFEDEWLSQGNDPISVEPVLADKKLIKGAITRNSSNLTGHIIEVDKSEQDISITNFENVIEIHPEDVAKIDPTNVNYSVEEILHWALFYAITTGASDLHLEKYYNILRFRARFDGNLKTIYTAVEEQLPKFISVIKNAAKMGQSRQEAQDGRYTILIGRRQVDVRVAAVPTRSEFQKIIMRFLDKQEGLKKLSDLNLSRRHSEIVKRVMNRDQGLVLVTGPTGSGKTTTLYAMLQDVNTEDVNIQTIEDPIEYEIEGINQTQVDTAFDLDFANGLRALMRADPDIILIGETRDEETASAAVNASLTGHLVLTTLHANDSLRAVSRLLSMSVEPYLLADSLAMTQAQRLIRNLCGYCKQPVEASQEIQEHFFQQGMISDPLQNPIYTAVGCQQCRNTGYKGRIALMEMCEITTEISDLVGRNAPQSEMRAIAKRNGVLTLYQEGVNQIIAGNTTLDEIGQLSYTAI